MLINLKNMAAKAATEHLSLELHDRLPPHVSSPCIINCQYSVIKQSNYYLLTLITDSKLTIICQRCLKAFDYQYNNEIKFAVCHSDEEAEKLMDQYECVTAEDNHVELNDLVTDEMYLSTLEFHPEIKDCDSEINRFIGVDHTIKS